MQQLRVLLLVSNYTRKKKHVKKKKKTLNIAKTTEHMIAAVAVCNNEVNEAGATRVTPYSFTRVNSWTSRREKEF